VQSDTELFQMAFVSRAPRAHHEVDVHCNALPPCEPALRRFGEYACDFGTRQNDAMQPVSSFFVQCIQRDLTCRQLVAAQGKTLQLFEDDCRHSTAVCNRG
jgi:hypothetical protein